MTKNEPADKEKPSPWKNRKHLTMWALIVLFVAAWMFALGIFVGRKTTPVAFNLDKLEGELAALKQADIEKQRKKAKIDSDTANGKIDFDYYDKLKESKNINKRKPATKKPKIKPLSEKKIKKRTKKKDIKTQIAKPSKPPQKEKSIKPERKNKGEKKLTIQVASLKDSKDADRMVERLKKKGYAAYKVMGVIPDKGIWFRVRVGHYKSSAGASDTIRRLEKDGLDVFLVNR
ncbi:MAG: SPOR domain-containing protein [Thermodesulfobacteriota bacterium]|nr:SPOR domain-containing protein [Thermodesulfobacteriota bacterium]